MRPNQPKKPPPEKAVVYNFTKPKRFLRRVVLSLLTVFISVALLITLWSWPLPPKAATGKPATDLPVLVYHAIHIDPWGNQDGMTVISLWRFAEQMRYLYEEGYTTLSVDEVVQFMHDKKAFPPKVVAITIDDGLLSSLYAVPVLIRYGFKASFWIITGLAQPDPKSPGADKLYMGWSTLKLLDKMPGMELFSHTVTHPWEKGNRLTDWAGGWAPGKTIDDARFELTESKKSLEEHLGYPVPYLVWPTGIYDHTLVYMAQEAGYKALFTTNDDLNHPGDDILAIDRTLVNGKCDLSVFKDIVAKGSYHGC